MNCYLSGLFPEIQRELATYKPISISDALATYKPISISDAEGDSSSQMALSLAALPLPPPLSDDLDSDEPPAFQVSLHALFGSSSHQTKKLFGTIGGHSFRVLIDSGSTRNLIQPRVAKYFGLALAPAPPFSMTVGNGDRLHCLGKLPAVSLGLQGHCFDLDLYLLEVWGADVILGIQWLVQFGPIVAD
ncbi:Aspartic peptidase [Corchorus olitorius]|uniref:Aspartic peptidase n=1 Tax=Corchorus olitorius TaxID=93759 RepID=A0A1R3J430_9ROSI|nr:Aspartic peptidase [Corchorus olitorius]